MGRTLTYRLDHTAALTSHFRRSGEFDSRMEADFAAEFHAKFGDQRGRWLLTREDEVILLGDTVTIPDFALTHKQDGRRALIEIMGFWHPDYFDNVKFWHDLSCEKNSSRDCHLGVPKFADNRSESQFAQD